MMNLSGCDINDTGLMDKRNSSCCPIDAEFRYILFPIIYSVVFFLGLLENCYVLWIFKYLTPSNSINEIKIIMVNLSVADLLFILTLPFWVTYYISKGDWIFPEILCRLAGCLFFINTYCSIAFLAVISYNRYCAVAYPIETIQTRGRKRAGIISAVIWLTVVLSALPFLVKPGANKVGNLTRCFEGYSSKAISVAIMNFILIGAFFIAFLIVIICNVRILSLLLAQPGQPRKSRTVRKQAFRMVCAVIVVFLICFVPHHLVQGPWTLTVLELWREDDCAFRKQVNNAHQITLCLMGLNCMLDPIIYCFLTQKFRKFITHSVRRWRSTRKSSQTTSCEANIGEMGIQNTSTGQM